MFSLFNLKNESREALLLLTRTQLKDGKEVPGITYRPEMEWDMDKLEIPTSINPTTTTLFFHAKENGYLIFY